MSQPSLFELIEVGLCLELGEHRFERDEIISFATKFDPQRFHLSDEGAADSHFGKLCASGWHTASQWMKFNVVNGYTTLAAASGYDGPPTTFGPSPGFRNMKWLLPVYVGDTIRYTSTVTGKRTMPKRPGWGMTMSRAEAFNQNGDCVMQFDGAVTISLK